MQAFSLLTRSLREYIYQSGWQELHPIQKKAIQFVHESENNFILAAPTASGKTEAAFLPAINSIKQWDNGVKIIYISPLIALINDQFKRLLTLCDHLDISVTSWHGEANSTEKKKLVKKPNGIILITPESIEAMLVNRPHEARQLFANTEWVIVDEIHSFLGNNRGIQVMSLLNRLNHYFENNPRCIGLSATLNREDYLATKEFFQNQRETSVIVDRGQNKKESQVFYFPNYKSEPLAFIQGIDVIYQAAQNESMLVFPNSRNKVEEIGSSLNQRADKFPDNQASFFVHHASLPKQTRQFAEQFAKESRHRKFTICCTSTLELGIDIGSVDSIVQYGPPPSVAALSQRLGRSGRRSGVSKLRYIANTPWELLQGLAIIELLEEGELDNTPLINQAFDVLAHQIISILIEHNGLTEDVLVSLLREGRIWQFISDLTLEYLINSLIDRDYIELMDNGELIAGNNAQPLLKMAEFYTQFFSEPELSVYYQLKNIGTIALDPGLMSGDNILLSGKVWHIQWLDFPKKQVHVIPAKKGDAYFESKGRQDVSNLVRLKMKDILFHGNWENYAPEIISSLENLSESIIKKDGYYYQLSKDGDPWLITFLGSKANRSLVYLIELLTGNRLRTGESSVFLIGENIEMSIALIQNDVITYQQLFDFFDKNNQLLQAETGHLKYQKLLPKDLLIDYVINEQLDLDAVFNFLNNNLK